MKDGKLELRSLDESFFKAQTIESQAQLTALIEKNLDNQAMYDKEPGICPHAPPRSEAVRNVACIHSIRCRNRTSFAYSLGKRGNFHLRTMNN